MVLDNVKLLRQKEGVAKWIANKGKGTLNWVTGMGKTFASLKLVVAPFISTNVDRNNKAIDDINNRLTNVIVIVPTTLLKEQWLEKINEIIPHHRANIYVDTVQYFQSSRRTYHCGLVIYDEIHEYLAEDRCNIFEWIKAKFILGLTATFEDRYLRHNKIVDIVPIVDIINETEALEAGYISKHIIFNFALELDEQSKVKYKQLTKDITDGLKIFDNNLELAYSCVIPGSTTDVTIAKSKGWTSVIEYNYNIGKANNEERRIVENWSPYLIKRYASELTNAVQYRKNILYSHYIKINVAKDIIARFNDRKVITFSQSNKFTDKLTETLNKANIKAVPYHSGLESRPMKVNKANQPSFFGTGDYVRVKSGKTKDQPKVFGIKTLQKIAINSIKTGEARVICSSVAADKGFDVEDLSLSITCSSTSNSTQYMQRKGRATRVDRNNSRYVYIINLFFKGTIEQEWYRKASATTQIEQYNIKSIDEINDNPNTPLFDFDVEL